MIRMDLVVAPGIVGEDQVGFVYTDRKADLLAQRHRALELAVVVAEEHEFLHADRLTGRPLLFLPCLSESLRRHLRIVRALVPAREKAVGHMCAALDEA